MSVLVLTVGVSLLIHYRQYERRTAKPMAPNQTADKVLIGSPSLIKRDRSNLPPVSKDSYRVAYRKAHDYSLLVDAIKLAANSGNPVAEYVTAKALRYCADNSKPFFGANGSRKTFAEVQVRMGKTPGGYQLTNEIYDHCHSYLDDPTLLKTTADWEKWLNLAVVAGYAPAQTEKADVLRVADLMQDAQNATSGDVIQPSEGQARALAMTAVLSGNPDSILGMANWVDGTKHSGDEYYQLVSAWELLACQRGYDDCGADSQCLRAVCMYDPQCADDSNVIDSLRRQFGSGFDDVDRLAAEIGKALEAGDLKAVESFM